MPLNKDALASQLKETFKKSKDENWSSDRVAEELATAIDAFVKGGSITSVIVEVKDASNNVIGTGTQKGTGKIE